ncbi:sulfatase-like hydrolase/transferase [Halorarius litoreus]|uniref:sulfatase-like hydrolase/transferase n=1 Tax=Halorarius litoreus TaxID=2962676 RepID=UPI0020CF71A3|nr:sulfatase-like hydrolase/transferase [Halorarius litoreus]
MSRNVVLVVLDTVRKDYFDEYAPRLRETSTHSFEQCRSASSWSVPSHTSIFTGQLPHQHGVHSESFDAGFDFADALSVDDTFLADLPAHRTVGLSANAYINSLFGFDTLFDAFHDFSIGSHTNESLFPDGLTVQDYMSETDEDSAAKRYLGFLRTCLDHDHAGKSLANGVWSQVGHRFKRLPLPEFVDDGASVISETLYDEVTTDEPVFAFVNYMDAHTPLRNLVQYDDSLHSVSNTWSSTELSKWELNREDAATAEYADNYRDLYGAAVDYLDRQVTDVVERIQTATDRETTVVVTADHGHNLGFAEDDGGLFHHTGSQSEGLLHVPFEIINPPEGWAGVETEYLSHCQLGDIVRRLAHDEPFDESLVGEPVAAETVGLLGEGDGTWGLDFSPSEYAYWNRMIRTVYDGPRKYEWDSLGETYEYRLDPGRPCWQEETSRGIDVPAHARECFGVGLDEYKRRMADTDQDMAFDDAVEDRLQTLGYL